MEEEEDERLPEQALGNDATTEEVAPDTEGRVGGGGVGREEEEVEEDDEEGEEEEEEEEDEEGYALPFDGDVDPLVFAREENHCVELYQQFERLEYEAIAERKRKALHEQGRAVESVKKPRREDPLGVTMEEIDELMNFGRRRRRRSKALKRKGRKKGSKKPLPPEVSRRLGDATLYYASGNYHKAIPLLEETVRIAPNISDAYHLLGLIYDTKGDRGKSMNFHMIAAHLSPKDPTIWRKLIAWSIEQKNTGQIRYCLRKAITADPEDVGLRFNLASLYSELGEYQKAAESYEQIVELCPASIGALKMAAKMYKKCGAIDRSICVLEKQVNEHSVCESSIVDMLLGLYMDNGSHKEAIKLIELVYSTFGSEKRNTLYLKVKEAVCYARLGNMQHAEDLLKDMKTNHSENNGDLIIEAADAFFNLEQYHYALKFYSIWKEIPHHEKNGYVHLKIAQCFLSMGERGKAIPFYYKVLSESENNVDDRIILSSLLLEEGKEQETINLLSPPKVPDQNSDLSSAQMKPWWQNGKVKIQLAKVYHSKGMLEDFTDTIYSYVRDTLVIEIMNQKLRPPKKIAKSILSERAKLLDEPGDNLFRGFTPVARMSELAKAARARKSLRKLAALKEEKKAAALAAGLDWQSDSEDETLPRERQEKKLPPLPDFLKDKEHLQFILDLCKALVSLRRYWEALEIINHTLKLEYNTISDEKREEFRSMGAYIAYICSDPKHGYNYVRYIVQQHPYSIAAWNCYYKVVSRFDSRFSRHLKFLHRMRVEHKDCSMPLIIYGHQFTMISQHQSAAEEYLKAYKVQPENPLINLCVGTALINIALGFRLQKKHNCIAQGFAFLYNYLRICNGSQEALYNLARAHQHVGLVTLATIYYEKVLAMQEEDYPIPKLPYEEDSIVPVQRKPGYCNLHREAAFNLHLIYKKSGATDLARQLLKNYCTF